MTGAEHRARAEQLLAGVVESRRRAIDPMRNPAIAFDLGEALVHAILAIAAKEHDR